MLLTFPAPQNEIPAAVPYAAPSARVSMDASAVVAVAPTMLTLACSPVGMTYTSDATRTVCVYATDTPQNVTVSVSAMFCLAVGVTL